MKRGLRSCSPRAWGTGAAKVVFYGQDPTPTGTNPYTGSKGFCEGKTAQQLLAAFPWSHLQLLQMELHSTS
jgi:hypothetical protein